MAHHPTKICELLCRAQGDAQQHILRSHHHVVVHNCRLSEQGDVGRGDGDVSQRSGDRLFQNKGGNRNRFAHVISCIHQTGLDNGALCTRVDKYGSCPSVNLSLHAVGSQGQQHRSVVVFTDLPNVGCGQILVRVLLLGLAIISLVARLAAGEANHRVFSKSPGTI